MMREYNGNFMIYRDLPSSSNNRLSRSESEYEETG